MALFKRKPATQAPASAFAPDPSYRPRPLSELMNVAEPAWPDLLSAISRTTRSVQVLPVKAAVAEQTLHRLQITARSPMGAVALNSGGLLLDNGWLRVLGGSAAPLLNMADFNHLPATPSGWGPPAFVFAYDVLGGVYRVVGVGPDAGKVQYCGADMLDWETYDIGYGAFLYHLIEEGFDVAYEDLRWLAWREDAAKLTLDEGFSVYPFLFAAESRPIELTSRRAVPMRELFTARQAIEGLDL